MDQPALRHCLGLSSSYLISDTTMNTETGASSGLTTWNTGFNRLVDLLVVLHVRGELELQTMDVASKACSECWTVAGAWDMVEARKCVKARHTNLTFSAYLTPRKGCCWEAAGIVGREQENI